MKLLQMMLIRRTANRKAEAMVRQYGFIVDRLIPTSYPGEPPYLLMRRPARSSA